MLTFRGTGGRTVMVIRAPPMDDPTRPGRDALDREGVNVTHLDFVVLTVDHPDFYAGAIAMFAVVLFTKFATHHVRQVRADAISAGARPSRGWYAGHWICAATAWLGLAVSFLVLAEISSSNGFDKFGRLFVGAMALISGTLLAWDVAVAGHNPYCAYKTWRKEREKRVEERKKED